MSIQTRKIPIRLALRHEGNWWNAYIAEPGTMKGATLIGSVMIGPLMADPALKDRFLKLMKDVMAHGIKDVLGREPDSYDVHDAPESERSGNA